MKNFGIIPNKNKDKDLLYTNKLIDVLTSKNCNAIIQKENIDCIKHVNQNIKLQNTFKDVVSKSDVLISLGGDGSFLKLARKIFVYQTPIVGINLGNLGFLADIDGDNMPFYIDKIINEDFFIQKRMVLDIKVIRDNEVRATDLALNDAVVTSSSRRKMIHLNTYVNDTPLEYMPGDGIIIATPTGSTAYSLSAGGPLIEPDVEMMVLTPICPHNLHSRTCVFSSDRTIKISLHKDFKTDGILTTDGKNTIEITKEDTIYIKKSELFVNILKLNSDNFFDILREKIYNRDERQKR